uniref:CxC2-like cysteine cluster KDZ transposase-associated domain-containing protein n=1 Tax=Mycena chlorophos TaxID=658473 RepID=A0ABQ0KUN2_MYCCL|nr:predicted protein [Mycena chlorophos]
MAGTQAHARRARKAYAAASSSRLQLSVDDLFQPEVPAFNDQTTLLSANARRKRTHGAPVEAPSPMKARKRPRRHSISVIDTGAFALEDDFYLMDLDQPDEVPLPRQKVFRPSDPALSEWTQQYRNSFLQALLWHDGRGAETYETCAHCHVDGQAAVYRCDDCVSGQMFCRECCVEAHRLLPLHSIQKWDSSRFHFTKKSLKELGLRAQLGHAASNVPCPRPNAARDEVVVLHDNGIHIVAFDYCGCERAEPEYLQLLRSRFFPATVRRPQTCATFACLDRLNAFSLKPKTNTFDFYDTLERLTNGAGERPFDRYRMLLRMGREWRHLLLLKRGGRFGYQSNEAENTSPGELAVLCPACPRPGVNLPEKWEDAPSETNYIYSQLFAMDACFQLKRRMVSNEARDPSLGPGFAFMVEAGPYREFLRKSTNKQEMSTCSGLKALDHSNTKFSKGYAATGVGMVVCARHKFVQPTSVGDLQKGERFSNMDYLFASMLRHISQILRKVVSYDIVCQWYKNIFERLTQLPPFLKFVLYRRFTTFVVPKLHILGHIAECRSRFNLDLTSGGGQTDAEGIERAWAAAGGLSGSTKMMGPGARSDMLDAYWSFWNWTKVIGLPSLLRQRLEVAKVEVEKQREAFELFSEEQSEHISAWEKMVKDYEEDKKGNKNPFVAVAKEFALAVETQQRRIKAQAALKKSKSTAEEINLGGARRKLNRDQQTLRTLQATFTPEALSKLAALSLPENVLAEDVPLLLPSALAASWIATAGANGIDEPCKQLLSMERQLRCAQMHSALPSMRNHLHVKWRLLKFKEDNVRHQTMNTRSRTTIARNESQISLFADMYQIAWFAVLQIEGGNKSKVGFHRLQREDIRYMEDPEVFSKKAERARVREEKLKAKVAQIRDEEGWSEEEVEADPRLADPEEEDDFFMKGSNKTVMSWIWRGTVAGGSEDEMQEAIRIEWCKARERLHHWEEEVNFLIEETRRVAVTHEEWALRWDERAKSVPVGSVPEQNAEGMIAYAMKQATMHRKLAMRARIIAVEPRLARGRKRIRVVPAPINLLAPTEEPDEEDEEETGDETEAEMLEERGDWDSDDETW